MLPSESICHSTHIHVCCRQQFVSLEFETCQGPGDWWQVFWLHKACKEVGENLQLLVMQLVHMGVTTLEHADVFFQNSQDTCVDTLELCFGVFMPQFLDQPLLSVFALLCHSFPAEFLVKRLNASLGLFIHMVSSIELFQRFFVESLVFFIHEPKVQDLVSRKHGLGAESNIIK